MRRREGSAFQEGRGEGWGGVSILEAQLVTKESASQAGKEQGSPPHTPSHPTPKCFSHFGLKPCLSNLFLR